MVTKKNGIIFLFACLLLVGVFILMGMKAEPAEPTREEIAAEKQEALQVFFDDMIEMYKESDPEMAAYYAKWRNVEFPDPYPAEWQNEDGSMKDFVTVEMLYEAFKKSNSYEYIMDDPMIDRGWRPSIQITLDENRKVQMISSLVQ